MSEPGAEAIGQWKSAIGRELVQSQVLDEQSLQRYALALGLAADCKDPPLGHWAYFTPAVPDAEIGTDGHPRRGDFLPAITLPRRMFAGSSIEFSGALEPGEKAALTSTIADVSHKAGQSGDLIFVKVDRRLEQRGAVKLREQQTYVYRGGGPAVSMPVPADQHSGGEVWRPDEVNLFRFSAATFNSHRIHYDLPYTVETEGYPALVVHGPFTAAKLAGLASRDGKLASFSFRAMAPLFLGQPIFLQKGAEAGEYCAVRADGTIAMTAKVGFQ